MADNIVSQLIVSRKTGNSENYKLENYTENNQIYFDGDRTVKAKDFILDQENSFSLAQAEKNIHFELEVDNLTTLITELQDLLDKFSEEDRVIFIKVAAKGEYYICQLMKNSSNAMALLFDLNTNDIKYHIFSDIHLEWHSIWENQDAEISNIKTELAKLISKDIPHITKIESNSFKKPNNQDGGSYTTTYWSNGTIEIEGFEKFSGKDTAKAWEAYDSNNNLYYQSVGIVLYPLKNETINTKSFNVINASQGGAWVGKVEYKKEKEAILKVQLIRIGINDVVDNNVGFTLNYRIIGTLQ